MIKLPPGCTINYSIRIVIDTLSNEMVEWYKLVGGEVEVKTLDFDRRGQPIERTLVKYGSGRFCYWMQDGTKNVLLHFNQEDANIALMFIMKFLDNIINHNIKEIKNHVY